MRMHISFPGRSGRQTGLEVNWSSRGWVVQRWHATTHGRRYDPPIAGPFPTKRAAKEARCGLLDGGEVRDSRYGDLFSGG